MKNLEIVKILNNIADILEIQGIEFKPRAYRNAARGVEALTEDIKEIEDLTEIPGVGEHIAKKIEEIIKTGKLKYYEKLKKQTKIDIEQLNLVPGLGPKKINFLYKKLKIKNIKDLEQAIKNNKLQKLPGFGEETEHNLSRGIKFVKNKPKRLLYAHAEPIVNEITNNLKKLNFVEKIEVAGSYRRGKETIGDLDFLVVSKQPQKVIQAFTHLPDVKTVINKGTTKSSIRLTNDLQVDLRIVKANQFGSALMYFIGNKQHNIEVRKISLAKGYKLSEYGLFKKNKQVAGKTEQEIYKKLNLDYIPPELRENTGELKNKLPKLITNKDIQGVFHNHTQWSDGKSTMLELIKVAERLKLKFISFNDHFSTIKIAHPLDKKRLTKYLKEIDKVQKKTNLRIFSGVEIDILKDGKFALSKSQLKQMDVIIASVHLATKMSEKDMTKRVNFALENYPVNILAHPTDILINQREPIKINLEKVFQVAKNTNTFLEINSSPERMDLSGTNVKAAIKNGCKLAISTDAHNSHLENYKYGVLNARRGWAEKKDILNCWNLKKIEKNIN